MRIETLNLINKVAYGIQADRIVYVGPFYNLQEIKVHAAKLLLCEDSPALGEDVTIIAGPGSEPLDDGRTAAWMEQEGTYLCVVDGSPEWRLALARFLRLAKLSRHRTVFVFTNTVPTDAIYTVGKHVEGRPWAGDAWKTVIYLRRVFPGLEVLSVDSLPFGATLVWSSGDAAIAEAIEVAASEALAAELDNLTWSPAIMAEKLTPSKAGENVLDILARLPGAGAHLLSGTMTTVPPAVLGERRDTFSVEIAPEKVYFRSPAKIVAPNGVPSAVTRKFSEFGVRTEVSAPSIKLNHVKGAVLYGRGVVGQGKSTFFSDSAAEYLWRGNYPEGVTIDVETQRFHFDYPPVRSLSCEGDALLLKTNSASNYGHWLVDALPKLMMADPVLAAPKLTLLVPKLYSAGQDAVIESSIRLATRRNVELVRLEDREPISVAELYYVSPVSWHPSRKHPAALTAMRSKIQRSLGAEVNPRDIIYVSRRRTNTRRVVNEDAVVSWVESVGGRVLAPESLSFEEQVRAFSLCRLLIGATGAALTNCVFMPEGSRVLALAPWGMPDPFFWDICGICGIDYTCLICEPVDQSTRMNVDFAVDLDRLEEALKAA